MLNFILGLEEVDLDLNLDESYIAIVKPEETPEEAKSYSGGKGIGRVLRYLEDYPWCSKAYLSAPFIQDMDDDRVGVITHSRDGSLVFKEPLTVDFKDGLKRLRYLSRLKHALKTLKT